MKDFKWTGKYEMIEVVDWWCPSEGNWSMCPGPCPDGRLHTETRTRMVRSRLMETIKRAPETTKQLLKEFGDGASK